MDRNSDQTSDTTVLVFVQGDILKQHQSNNSTLQASTIPWASIQISISLISQKSLVPKIIISEKKDKVSKRNRNLLEAMIPIIYCKSSKESISKTQLLLLSQKRNNQRLNHSRPLARVQKPLQFNLHKLSSKIINNLFPNLINEAFC